MSSIWAIGTSVGFGDSAYLFAKTANQKRSLSSLGQSLDKGDLSAAKLNYKKTLRAFTPTFGSTSTLSGQAWTVLNNDLKALSQNLDKNDLKAAQGTWGKLKAHLTDAGVNLSNSSLVAAQSLSYGKGTSSATLASALYGNNGKLDFTSSFPGKHLNAWA